MGVVWTFLFSSILSLLSPSLWETTRYRLKYCLKGSLSPKSTNQPIIQSMERKIIGQIQGIISRRKLVRNPTIQYIIIILLANMTTLACTVSQKSLKKKFIIRSIERKKNGQIQGIINRGNLVCDPTVQHVIINLYTKYDTKYDFSSLPGGGRVVRWCWVNFQCRGVLQFGYSRARAYCARSRCGWGLFGHFYSPVSFLSSFSLSLGDGSI